MLNKIKSKLRGNLKILKFSKRYLVKYFSLNAIDPRKLKSGDIEWDLSLIDFLKVANCLGKKSSASFLEALSQGSSTFFESKQQDKSVFGMAAPMLWLISHYISAPASSHGLSLAYIGREIKTNCVDKLSQMIGNMPTSVKLTTFSFVAEKMTSCTYSCGGTQSSFETQDLSQFSHQHSDDRNCAFVIDTSINSIGYMELVEDILNKQRIIAYIVLLVDKGGQPWIPATAKNWDIKNILEFQSDKDLILCTNRRWQQDLISINDLRFKESQTLHRLDGKVLHERILPLVSLEDFGSCSRVTQSSLEFISGAPIAVYSLGNGAQTIINKSTAPSFFTTSPVLFKASNVFISGVSIVWRDNQALSEIDLSHDFARVRGSSVVVDDELVCILKGEYYLVPTNNPHHSHLMHETLQHLHFILRYSPKAKLLISDALTKAQREYFASFGFPDDRCIYRNVDQTYQVEKLYFRGPLETTFDRQSIHYLQQIGGRKFSIQNHSSGRLYLSRRDARIYRNLINEMEIEKIFKSFGFEIVMTSELSAEQKIQLFSKAKYIAGALGAAFTYAPFANDAQHIILSSNMYFPTMFPQMAALQLTKINYIRGIGLKHFSDVWGYEHCSFYLPPSLVQDALSDILAE